MLLLTDMKQNQDLGRGGIRSESPPWYRRRSSGYEEDGPRGHTLTRHANGCDQSHLPIGRKDTRSCRDRSVRSKGSDG